ncbi:DUF6305 family protein [Oscillospiraceae bacterium 44-5]
MKNLFTALLCAVLTLSLLASCGGGGGNAGSSKANNSANPSSGSTVDAELPELTGGFETPILLTSAGQSADSDIIKTLCTKANITVDLENQATADHLDGVKTLLISVGGSSKGLGAAGIDADQEIARFQDLIQAAQDADIKIIAMHVGGAPRRGDLSDKFLPDPFNAADAAVVVSGGDTDGVIRSLLAANRVPTAYVDSQADCIGCLTTLFS